MPHSLSTPDLAVSADPPSPARLAALDSRGGCDCAHAAISPLRAGPASVAPAFCNPDRAQVDAVIAALDAELARLDRIIDRINGKDAA